jgi:hypothetical protein
LRSPQGAVGGLVGEQAFLRRQPRRRHGGEALGFVLGQPQAVVEVSPPAPLADRRRRSMSSSCMNSPPTLAWATKAKSSRRARCSASRRASALLAALGAAAPVVDLGVAPEHFEAHAHFVDAVVQGLQLGGLVHHVFRAGDLAAVVQPGGDLEFVALGVAQAKSAYGPWRASMAVAAACRPVAARARWPPV